MKRTLIVLGSFLIIVLLVLIKIFVIPGKHESQKSPGKIPSVPVECYIVKDTSVNYQIETVGTVRANEQVDIVSEINRKIISIFLKEGANVTKGQLLFKLDDSDIRARINKLMIEEKLAGANESREKILLSKGGISQERYEEVSNRRQTIQAEIEVLKVDLDKTEIRAPFSGKIGLRNVSIGTMVNPTIVLACLVDLSRVKVDFSIPERYAGDLHVGSPVQFRTDYLDVDHVAVVEAIEPSVDVKTRTLLVRTVASNIQGQLIPGTSAKVALTLRKMNNSLFIPTYALIPSIKGYGVFIIRDGKAQSMMVKTGVRSRDYIQILEGLKIGDTVVLTNLLRIKNESPLKIKRIA